MPNTREALPSDYTSFYTKGTIKVKNADGQLVPFYPNTKEDCVVDMNSGTSLSTIIENMEDDIEVAANSGGVKVKYVVSDTEMETFANNQSNETLMTFFEEDAFIITVDTTKLSSNNKIAGIPFNLIIYHDNITLTVDWGDGTTSTLTKNSYQYSQSRNGSNHTYSTAGIYTITVKSSDWENTYISTYKSNLTNVNVLTSNIYYFKNTLVSVNKKLPKVKGTITPSDYNSPWTTSYWTESNELNYLFYRCSSLTSIPTGLFDNNTNVTDFSYCFTNCTSLTTIPTDLFKYNTAVNTFKNCFGNCTLLTSIPIDLFKYNTSVTSFYSCFYGCSSLTSIPTDLFRYNTDVTTFGACFWGCTSLALIPQDLFRYNTAVTTFGACFRGCTSLTSIPTDLFRYNINITTLNQSFENCTALTSIPTDLFRYNINITDINNFFSGCSSLNDFSIHIGSTKVSSCNYFVTKKTGTTRTVYVPTGSTTQTKFNGQASTLGLTIIAE